MYFSTHYGTQIQAILKRNVQRRADKFAMVVLTPEDLIVAMSEMLILSNIGIGLDINTV